MILTNPEGLSRKDAERIMKEMGVETMTKLLPCPFCGDVPDEDSHYINQGTKWGGILCCIEGPEVRTSYKPWPHFKEAAIEAWNTRVEPIADIEAPAFYRQYINVRWSDHHTNGQFLEVQTVDGWQEAYPIIERLTND